MNLTPEQQKHYYNDYWHKIEKLTKPDNSLSYNVSDFVRDYLTVKTKNIPNKKNVHAAFKVYVMKNNINIDELLSDMLKYARYYDAIRSAQTRSEHANQILKRFKVLKANVYNKIFPTLHGETLKHNAPYVDSMKYVILSKNGKHQFPTDKDFSIKLEEKDITELDSKLYLFARLEDGDDAPSDVLDKLLNKEYVLDRIMPKTLYRSWRNDLGLNAESIHSFWCNRMANFTVVDADAKLGNRSFGEKKTMSGGFGQSPLRLNKSIAKCLKWTDRELRNRQKELKLRALKLWAYPKSTFKPSIQGYELHSLEDGFNFTGRDIVSFSLLGDRYSVRNWTDMLVQVLKIVYTLDSSHLYQFANGYN